MKILRPIKITDSHLVSCSIPENDYPAWSAATTYARGAFVISPTTHTVYRSLQDGNLNHNPDLEQLALADPLIDDPDPVQWQIISATNRWRLFDGKPSVRATDEDEIVVELAPAVAIAGVAGFEISAAKVRVTMTNAGEVVYEREIAMQDETVIGDWYSYYFEPITELSEFVLVDLPPYANAVVKVEALRPGGDVSVGQIVLGPVWAIGSTAVKGTGFQGVDFSYVEQDEFGDLTTVRRAATRLSTFEVWVDNAQLLGLDARLRGLRGGTAAVWVGDTDARKAAMNYGFYRGYRSAYQTDGHSLMQIEVQGIV
ncbi:hypothetical protein DWF04_000010 [Cereibacter sphaeroides f. sp. denitrificans]|nr:hypothetical protein DWF04_16075 [Cereibacter sphaeroides f. sp. denitrificans]